MNTVEIEWGVREALKSAAAHAGDPPLDRPLGELGLDSMALLQLLTALEKKFNVEFGDEVWSTRGQVTPTHLVEWIRSARPSTPPEATNAAQEALDRLKTGLAWRADAINLYRKVSYYILVRDLAEMPIPELRSSLPVEIRETPPHDFIGQAPEWAGTSANLQRWANVSGVVLLTAWHQGVLAATDWISPSGDDDPTLGVRVQCVAGSCFGYGLFENPELAARGIGLELAARSLAESKKRGFVRQATMVHVANEPMLMASSHLLGFEKAGRIDTTSVFGKPHARWSLHGENGVGGDVRL